jgi:hypothetical protein
MGPATHRTAITRKRSLIRTQHAHPKNLWLGSTPSEGGELAPESGKLSLRTYPDRANKTTFTSTVKVTLSTTLTNNQNTHPLRTISVPFSRQVMHEQMLRFEDDILQDRY